MKTQITVLIFILIALLSCNQSTTNHKTNLLEASETNLSYALDSYTKTLIHTLLPYEESNGQEYLTFQPLGQNRILFYNLRSCNFCFEIKADVEGANGVGFFDGYYIHNLDSIYLSNSELKEIAIINRDGIVKDVILYEQAEDGIELSDAHSITTLYKPFVVIGDQMYIISRCNRWHKVNPVSASINMNTKKIIAQSFVYPTSQNTKNIKKAFGIEEYMSRCYDGNRFVYSFYFDENIYVATVNHDSVYPVKAKSKYIDAVTAWDDYGNLTAKDICENPNYGNILYDKYRDVYYRIAYPKTEIKEKLNEWELFQYGRKKFSILVLDKNLKVIGETKFPNYTYHSQLMFIREDGLYISTTHIMNPQYSDDILSFQKFNLVK